MTQELILRGADIVKVGIDQVGVCNNTYSNRWLVIHNYQQSLSALDAHGLVTHQSVMVCTCFPGMLPKHLELDFVMLGGMLGQLIKVEKSLQNMF